MLKCLDKLVRPRICVELAEGIERHRGAVRRNLDRLHTSANSPGGPKLHWKFARSSPPAPLLSNQMSDVLCLRDVADVRPYVRKLSATVSADVDLEADL